LRRWVVTIGVGATRDVTVRITPQTGSSLPASRDFQTLIVM
jgi:hypothetical protein